MYTAMWSRSSHSTSVTCSNKKSTRRIEARGRAVWVDVGRGGRADRHRRIRARKVAAREEGRRAGGRARPLNSEGNIFWGVVVVVVRRLFHGTTERRVTLFSILSFFFSLPVSLCVCRSRSPHSLRCSGWGNTVSRGFIPVRRVTGRAQKPINRRNLSRARGGRLA